MRVIYAGTMETLEVSTSAAWVKIPLTNAAWTSQLGDSITANIDLSIAGVNEPNYRSVLFFMLLGGWANQRQLDIWLKLELVTPIPPAPQIPVPIPDIGDWKVDDPNFPGVGCTIATHMFFWSCERVVAHPT